MHSSITYDGHVLPLALRTLGDNGLASKPSSFKLKHPGRKHGVCIYTNPFTSLDMFLRNCSSAYSSCVLDYNSLPSRLPAHKDQTRIGTAAQREIQKRTPSNSKCLDSRRPDRGHPYRPICTSRSSRALLLAFPLALTEQPFFLPLAGGGT